MTRPVDLPSADAGRARDAELLEQIRAGDAGAFGAWLKIRWHPLVRYCARILPSGDSAEDVAQEAFIRFWENRARWKSRSSPRAILYTIARNLALNQRASLATRLRLLTDRRLPAEGRWPSPQEGLEAEEFHAALERAIARLPSRQREVLTLSRIDGLSRAEVAEVTGLAPQTVANHLVAALVSLRRALGPFLRDD
ncbi:MAG: sigma-70 family RNA polymerase sigma factor [Gemmatimonadetes bacterium]|nr:sigma-70 family RNA polymerase sigma factor [Gemmatimonadota bacterium]